LEERRIYVHVFKHLRRQQAKLDSNPDTQAGARQCIESAIARIVILLMYDPGLMQGQKAFITLKAVSEVFPSRPPAMIRSYLKDSCDLVVHVSPSGPGAVEKGLRTHAFYSFCRL
jgi:hypothetical protein